MTSILRVCIFTGYDTRAAALACRLIYIASLAYGRMSRMHALSEIGFDSHISIRRSGSRSNSIWYPRRLLALPGLKSDKWSISSPPRLTKMMISILFQCQCAVIPKARFHWYVTGRIAHYAPEDLSHGHTGLALRGVLKDRLGAHRRTPPVGILNWRQEWMTMACQAGRLPTHGIEACQHYYAGRASPRDKMPLMRRFWHWAAPDKRSDVMPLYAARDDYF